MLRDQNTFGSVSWPAAEGEERRAVGGPHDNTLGGDTERGTFFAWLSQSRY